MKNRSRAVLGAASSIHFLHDGFSETLYVFLPIWARDFGLSLAQVGAIRSAYTGAMSAFQIPAGFLAERWGERRLLAAGTLLTACGFIAAGWAGGFGSLLVLLLIAGLGSGVQHPLSSSIVSKAFEAGRLRTALGTYNFSGDVGKAGVAAGIGLLAGAIGWRAAGATYGVLGVAAALAIVPLLSRLGAGAREAPVATTSGPASGAGWGIRDSRGFSALCAIGMVDNATRTGFLTFMPFMLMSKELTVGGVGLAFSLVFIGGAAGKFVCGLAADRVGVIRTVVLTEAATTLLILVVVAAPLSVALGGADPARHRAQRHLVRALRHRRRSRLQRAALTRLRSLLHDDHRRLRPRAHDLGRGRRHRRRSDHPHAGRPRRPGHDPPLPAASPRRRRPRPRGGRSTQRRRSRSASRRE